MTPAESTPEDLLEAGSALCPLEQDRLNGI